MRNVMKAATLESKFPILSVEHDCIISKDADITICYRVELPELFTVTQAEYEAIHSAWAKAVKVLPNYSIVHKQDFFIEESYTPELTNEARAEASSLDYALQGGRKQGQIKNRAKFDSVKSPNHKKNATFGDFTSVFSAYLENLLYLRMKNKEDENRYKDKEA